MRTLLSLLIVALPISASFAQSPINLWEDATLESIVLPRGAEMSLSASRYRLLRLEVQRAESLLRRAPSEGAKTGELPFILPLPEGGTEVFRVVASPVMAPELGARYPQIRTFLAQGIRRPELTARLDITPAGFHGAVVTPNGLYYIDPLAEGQRDYYAAYYTRDLQFPEGREIPHCGVTDIPLNLQRDLREEAPDRSASRLRGAAEETVEVRTYRLALACTGEYGQAKGGNKTAVLASMVTSINRVNQIFEKETAIRLQLIANNDTLIYLNGASDPYISADNAPSLLGQNTLVLNQVIGASAYDLGHVFTLSCTNSIGGIARYASACGPEKGAGVTCHFTNSVEFIAVQIMAHELGHQFSCAHSWNSCPDYSSQYDVDDAFEPGSGSTIMSYAGGCGADNVQSASDDYYHVGSLDDFYSFSRKGQGNTCATLVPTGNRAPALTLKYPKSFAIPAGTPFQLEASATDADGDPLTYCWEQYDIGPSTPLGEASFSSPLFRSYRPGASPVRTIPRISALVNNEKDKREILPTYARKLTFRCTVRDNHPGGAGVVWGQVQFDVTDKAGPFLVTSPNAAGISWITGSTQTVTWDVAKTDLSPVNCQYVNIRLSVDGGLTYPYLLAQNARNTGSAQVTVPGIITESARIKVEAADNIFFDISNVHFSIVQTTTPGYALSVNPYTEPLHCQPLPLKYTVYSTRLMAFNTPILLELITPLPQGSAYQFSKNPIQPGDSSVLSITLANTPNDTLDLVIRATAQGGPLIERTVMAATLSNDFSGLKMASPADGSTGIVLSTPLSWTPAANAASYTLELATSPRFGSTVIARQENITGNSFQPSVLLENNRLHFWRIQPVNLCGAASFLDPFTFHTATVTCTTLENNVPVNIAGAGTPTIESRITVSQSGILNDVNIPLVRINKEYVRNLKISLVSPKGTEVVLYNGHCALTSKLLLGFDDEAPQSVTGSGVCPPDDGIVFRPTQMLSAFKGESIQGVWTLKVAMLRNESLSPGALESWKLEFCSTQTAPPPVLVKNDTLKVPPGKTNTLTQSELQATDSSTPADQLRFTIVRPPAKGQLKAYGVPLATGDYFTQATINTFDLRYTHGNTPEIADDFTFVVENGKGGFISTKKFSIAIDANAIVDVEEVQESDGLRLYPNPADAVLYAAWNAPLPEEGLLELVNLQGARVRQAVLQKGQTQIEIPTSGLPAGMYLLRVKSGARQQIYKFTIQR